MSAFGKTWTGKEMTHVGSVELRCYEPVQAVCVRTGVLGFRGSYVSE